MSPSSYPLSPMAKIALGFVAGFLAVPTFHHAMIALLGAAGMIQPNLYSMRPVPPFGVPQIFSQAFWGGLWGVLFVLLFRIRPRALRFYLAGLLFGGIALPLAGWFIVAPIKGQPIASGWVPMRMLMSVFINGAWGLGLAVLLALGARTVRRDTDPSRTA